jgi:predicted dehydrogenase
MPGWSATSIVLRDRDGRERRVEIGGANHYLHQIEHFASLVLDRARDAWPSENGVANVSVCEAIARSYATGRRLTRAGSSWTAGPL